MVAAAVVRYIRRRVKSFLIFPQRRGIVSDSVDRAALGSLSVRPVRSVQPWQLHSASVQTEPQPAEARYLGSDEQRLQRPYRPASPSSSAAGTWKRFDLDTMRHYLAMSLPPKYGVIQTFQQRGCNAQAQ